MQWKIAYYSQQVFDNIRMLPRRILGKYLVLTERMMQKGPDLGMPHTRAMGQGLFELRVKEEEGIARVFYGMKKGKEIIMLHSFVKKTQKTPPKELNLAIKRLKEVKQHD